MQDPWWNPAVEMQAIQRAHRIGQTQPVAAYRYCVQDSIEDDMLKIQEKKRLVFEGTVDGKAASMAKLTLKDLAFFFKN
jgi:DNA repair protein RAD16